MGLVDLGSTRCQQAHILVGDPDGSQIKHVNTMWNQAGISTTKKNKMGQGTEGDRKQGLCAILKLADQRLHGRPLVKTLCSRYRGKGLIPGQETKILHATQLCQISK